MLLNEMLSIQKRHIGKAVALSVPIALMLVPIVGRRLQLALSRSRQYDADLEVVQLTGDPEGLASTLQALQKKRGIRWQSILVRVGRTPGPLVLRTDPRTEVRVARLLALRSKGPEDV